VFLYCKRVEIRFRVILVYFRKPVLEYGDTASGSGRSWIRQHRTRTTLRARALCLERLIILPLSYLLTFILLFQTLSSPVVWILWLDVPGEGPQFLLVASFSPGTTNPRPGCQHTLLIPFAIYISFWSSVSLLVR